MSNLQARLVQQESNNIQVFTTRHKQKARERSVQAINWHQVFTAVKQLVIQSPVREQ
jgi:hypothetical protein